METARFHCFQPDLELVITMVLGFCSLCQLMNMVWYVYCVHDFLELTCGDCSVYFDAGKMASLWEMVQCGFLLLFRVK